jgi:hypothetical protein
MTDVKLVPQEVPVSGKNDLLKDVYTVYTKKVPLGAITRSGRMTVDLVLDNPSLNLTPDAKKVTIHYVVQKRTNSSVIHEEKE